MSNREHDSTLGNQWKHKLCEECLNVEVLEAGTTSNIRYKFCSKKEGHQQYISVNDLSLNHLPDKAKDDLLLNFIKLRCTLTGCMEISGKYTRCGTCFVQKVEILSQPCPCTYCQDKGKNPYGKITLSTTYHVMENDHDVKMCQVRLFYDENTDNGTNETRLFGLTTHSESKREDWRALVCVTHGMVLVQKLRNLNNQHWNIGCELKERYENSGVNFVVIVSPSHGLAKRVSVGELKKTFRGNQIRDGQEWCCYGYTAPTCPGSSGASVYVL